MVLFDIGAHEMTFTEHVETFFGNEVGHAEALALSKAAIAADVRNEKLLAARNLWAASQARDDCRAAEQKEALEAAVFHRCRAQRGATQIKVIQELFEVTP